MPTYLVETYARAPRANGALRGLDAAVRHLRCISIPGDETSFHVIEGPSEQAVADALRAASFEYERISEASDQPIGEEPR